ncbi:MAG TPA: isopentenyl-diphosphate Delta-isomerase [Hyphomicrobium sp.]|nr:isopentenyl-diphosphate Delta-isomerase [Hyphomicrobium sp.]
MDRQEYVILVDGEDQQIGTAEKLEAHRAGALHRAFSIVIWNSERRMLLQQRALGKYHSPGLWTNTCCGHPRPNEVVSDAATRRLAEEMGFTCTLSPLGTISYRAEFSNGLIEHEIVHVYRGLHNGAVAPNPEEAANCAWRTLDEVRHDIAAAPDTYSVWFRQYVAAEWPTAMTPPE